MTKERIVNQALKEVEERIKFLEHEIFDNDPVTAQINIHGKFNDFLRDTKGKDRLTDKSIKFINDLDKEMKKHQERQKKYDVNKLKEELVKLESELRDLINEKYNNNIILAIDSRKLHK